MASDLQPDAKTPAAEPIEITHEMIDAAYRVWEDSGASDYVSTSDKVMLHEIIVAALRARGPVRQIREYIVPEDEMSD